MQLKLQNEMVGGVMVVRCKGRIVVGEETHALQGEVQKLSLETKNFVLQLEEVNYIDSGGLGALVRMLGMLRADRGDLKLCQLSPFLLKVLQATNLLGVFSTHASEKEAREAFSRRPASPAETAGASKTNVLCIDSSSDLLAYLSVLLKRTGYDVVTTRLMNDAAMFMTANKPRLVICGPGTQANAASIEKLRQLDPKAKFLLLTAEFQATEASEAGLELVKRVEAVLKT